jgi:hypothetical protein
VTTIEVGVGSESLSVPCIVPLNGTWFCDAAEMAGDDDVPDDVMDGTVVGDVL